MRNEKGGAKQKRNGMNGNLGGVAEKKNEVRARELLSKLKPRGKVPGRGTQLVTGWRVNNVWGE